MRLVTRSARPHPRRPRPRACRQEGIALIMVLWAVALLTVIAGSYAFETRSEALLSANLVDKVKAEAAAEAGVGRVIAALLSDRDGDWKGHRVVRTLEFAGAELRLAAVSEHGRIDLNAAPEAIIREAAARALAVVPAPEGITPATVADGILDWRDADHARRPAGAEDEDYARAGRSYGAADQAFVSVAELSLVQGVSLEIFRALSGYFTVHTRASRVDPQAAGRAVLLAVPGLDPEAVERYVEARAEVNPGDAGRVPLDLLAAGAGYLSRTRPTIFAVVAEARLQNGAVARRGLIVRLARSRQAPYLVLARLAESDQRFDVLDEATPMEPAG